MAHIGIAFRQLVKLGQSTGAFISGRDFIQRNVPPRYRDTTLKVFKSFEQAATGAGLYKVYETLIAEDSPGNPSAVFQKKQYVNKTRKPYQTRLRRAGRYSRSRCPPNRYYKGNRFPRNR